MEFFNCDGSKAELFGNGLRCAALFAYEHGLTRDTSITFATGGGELAAEVIGRNMVRIELPVTEDFEADRITTSLSPAHQRKTTTTQLLPPECKHKSHPTQNLPLP